MINYMLIKLFHKFQIFFIKKEENGLYIKNKTKNKIKKVLFYFNNYHLMHFGDIIFFEPVIQKLINHGFDVEVSCDINAASYLKFNNIKIFNNHNFNKFDLIITKVEFISFFNKSPNQILFVDTTDNKINEPLCVSIINKISSFLKINDIKSVIASASNFIIQNNNLDILLKNNERYILFNNYTHSGKFRIFSNQRKKLIDCSKKFKKNGFKIIHIGTQEDKNNDKSNYEFIDLDLRGKTRLSDVFYLVSKNNVISSVSFDTMQILIFTLNNKKSFVVNRKRLLKSNRVFREKYVHKCFNSDDLITYV